MPRAGSSHEKLSQLLWKTGEINHKSDLGCGVIIGKAAANSLRSRVVALRC